MTDKLKKLIRAKKTKLTQRKTADVQVIVNKSNKNILATVFDLNNNLPLFTISSSKYKNTSKTNKAVSLAKDVCDLLKKKEINKVVFNRNGILFHGRIKKFADEMIANGIII